MARVEITKKLEEEINNIFKGESIKVFSLMHTLKENPTKGKKLGSVGGILIKELKYNKFRFYFITDGFKLKFLNQEGLTELLLRFVRMSDKKNQQKIINEIKTVLQTIGPEGFIE